MYRVYTLSVQLEIMMKMLVKFRQQVQTGTYLIKVNNMKITTLTSTMHAYSIAVAASDISDRRASFSNYGPCVDLIAPVRY